MTNGKRTLITGISGQDGSYLADALLDEGFHVAGLVRRKSDASNWRIRHLHGHPRFILMQGDLLDMASLAAAIADFRPHWVFNLAAQSFVPFSWSAPLATAQVTAVGALNLLEAIRLCNKDIRFYQASSSEMFGQVRETPQTESTPFYPRSPYGVSKVFGHWITVNYRESYDLFAVSGILFNHESERRGLEFVTRKVTWAAARIKSGLQTELHLGNLEAARDWGYAPDFVRAMKLMLQADEPQDYVVATGKQSTVRDLCELAFGELDLDWNDYVVIDQSLIRPAEVNTLLGDATKARNHLGWEPQVGFTEMIARMVQHDMARIKAGIEWEN